MPTIEDKEELPSVAAEAPTLVAAGITEDKLHEDLRPYEPEVKPEIIVPAHHIQIAYDCLKIGQSVEDAAKVASIPIEVAQKLDGEVRAAKAKLAALPPVKKGGSPSPVVEAPPLEEPIL